MSAAATAQAGRRAPSTQGHPRRAAVGPVGLLRAELLRSHRTFTWGVIGATAVFTIHTLILAHASVSAGAVVVTSWNGNALAWMHLYPAGFALPLGLLAGVMAQWREDRWRQGGTAWRAVDPRRVLAARVAVLSLSALACQAALIAPVVIDALIAGNGWGPWRHYLLFSLLMWIEVSGACAWGMAAYRLAGAAAVGAAPLAGLVWSIAGAVQAEDPQWWWQPWAWNARPVLPLLGVHGNSVLLEAGSPVWDYPLLPGFGASAALALLGVGAVLLLGEGTGRRALRPSRRPAPGPATASGASAPTRAAVTTTTQRPAPAAPQASARPGAVAGRCAPRALAGALPWRLWSALAVLLGLILAAVRLSYSAAAALGLLEMVGLPVACAVVGITAWGAVQPAWRALLLRRGPWALVSAMSLLGGALLVPVLLGAWAVACAGQPLLGTQADRGGLTGALYALVVMPAVAFMIASVSLAVAMCARPVAAIALTMVMLLSGLIIGGNDALASTGMWVMGPWAWMRVAAAQPQHWVGIIVLSTLIGGAALAVAVWRAAPVAVRDVA